MNHSGQHLQGIKEVAMQNIDKRPRTVEGNSKRPKIRPGGKEIPVETILSSNNKLEEPMAESLKHDMKITNA